MEENMKKRKLKKWVKDALEIALCVAIILVILICMVFRVQYFNRNIELCGNNYCDVE